MKEGGHFLNFKLISTLLTNVLKTGPDRPVRPVRPPAGHRTGPVRSFGPDGDRTGVEPVEPAVQPVNRPVQLILIFFFKPPAKRRRFDVSGIKMTPFWSLI